MGKAADPCCESRLPQTAKQEDQLEDDEGEDDDDKEDAEDTESQFSYLRTARRYSSFPVFGATSHSRQVPAAALAIAGLD